jgi:hypothetical protein
MAHVKAVLVQGEGWKVVEADSDEVVACATAKSIATAMARQINADRKRQAA